MAVTRAADVGDQIPEIWSDQLYAQAENLTFWGNLEGDPGSGMPIIRHDDLEKKAGDTIRTDIVLALTGSGITGDVQSLEGNEEQLKFRQQSVSVTQLSHGVRWTELTEVLINHDMRQTALNQLAKWLAGRLDEDIFDELSGNGATTMPTLAKWAAGSATSRATVADGAATGRLTLDDITDIKTYAQVEHKIEPVRVDEDGNEYFGLVLHPYTIKDLKKTDDWQQAQRDARERGPGNPLFTGAVGMWDGVILYSSNRVPRSSNGTVQTADNIFFGAQAMSRGYAMRPDWREELFDYGREAGIATVLVKGEALNVFDISSAGGAAAADRTAVGAMVLYAAAVAPSA